MPHMTKNINPRIRMVQANPIDLKRFVNMIGKTIPPADDPELTMPKTVARFLLNQEVVEVRDAEKMAPDPSEDNIDCESTI
jgi:hypothetical protein